MHPAAKRRRQGYNFGNVTRALQVHKKPVRLETQRRMSLHTILNQKTHIVLFGVEGVCAGRQKLNHCVAYCPFRGECVRMLL